MTIFTRVLNIQASDLPKRGGYSTFIHKVDNLELNNDTEVPGVQIDNVENEFGSVVVTMKVDDEDRKLVMLIDPDAEVEIREISVRAMDEYPICGRCNRHVLPPATTHIGC